MGMERSFYGRILGLAVLGGIFCLFSATSGWASEGFQPSVYTQPPAQACLTAISLAEKHKQLPRQLLQAIAMTESGRWDADKKQTYPWPWTVTSGKESWFFDSKAEAIAQVKKLQGQGRTNIDVGCMQVNLYHHSDAFVSLEAAFEPVLNARYAADYLRGLKNEYNSWSKAIRYYHSKNDEFNRPYRQKVYNMRTKLRAEEQAQLRAEVKRQAELRRLVREQAKTPAQTSEQTGQATPPASSTGKSAFLTPATPASFVGPTAPLATVTVASRGDS